MRCLLVIVIAVGIAHADDNIDPAAEIGFFGKCKGKEINFPPDLVSEATSALASCGVELSVDPTKPSPNKYCLGICVMKKFKLVKDDGTYDVQKARTMLESLKSDPEVTEIQYGALKKCTAGKKFVEDGVCQAAKEMDTCARKEQKEKCGD